MDRRQKHLYHITLRLTSSANVAMKYVIECLLCNRMNGVLNKWCFAAVMFSSVVFL